jgi:hypothetical protein
MASTLVLNGTETALATPEGREFVADCVRAGEGLISDSELRKKYEIAAAAWKGITKNKALIQAIRTESERRTRTGIAAQEAASKHFAGAPKVLNELMTDPKTHPKFRIESARELRAVAIGDGNQAGAPNADKFVININLGAKREHYEFTPAPAKELTADEIQWGWRDRE